MKKFLERSLRKLQQDHQERKQKQQFGELVEKQKEKVRIEFYATTQASGRDLTKDNQADGVKYANILNVIQNENSNKMKRKHELEEQTENLDKFEGVDSPTKSTFSEDKKKELVNWSINLSPEVFNKLTMEMAGQYNEAMHGTDLDYLKEKFQFLMENYEGIQTQLIKEQEITDTLENRITTLQEEEAVFIKRCNEAQYVFDLMQQCLTDTQKLQYTAKNKLVRTSQNLHLLKNEIKESNIEGKEYIERLNEDMYETEAATRAAEENYSELLVKIDLAKRTKQEYEKKWEQLVANEQQTVRKIKDSELTIKYIDVLSSLEKRFIMEQHVSLEGEMEKPSLENVQDKPQRTHSFDPRKKVLNSQTQSSDSQSNLLDSPTRKRILSFNRTSSERVPPPGSGRAYILRKIAAFCENHNLQELADKLLSIHRTMTHTEAKLKDAYEKGATEKRKKEDLLKNLEAELAFIVKSNNIIFEYEKTLKLTDEDSKPNHHSLPTTNQMDFEFNELLPMMKDKLVHKKSDSFLVVAYVYLIDTMIRISKLMQGIAKRSYKVSFDVMFAYEDINKYLSETLKVAPERLLRSDLDHRAMKKEQANSTGIMETLGRPRAVDLKQNEDKDKAVEKAGDASEGKSPANRVSKIPSIERRDSTADQIEGMIEIHDKLQVLSKAQIIEYFCEIFPGTVERAEQWADLVRNDQVALLIVSKEIVQDFLKKQFETHGVEIGSEKAISSITEFKKDIRMVLQERFSGMIERIEKLFLNIAENKESLEKEPKLLLRSVKIENIFNGQLSKNEDVIDANRERILKLLKYNDFDQYEIKNMIRGITKLEEQRRAKQRASKSLDEVRKMIHELAKDDKVRVNEHYSQLSKEKNKREPTPVELDLPEETKTMILKRKEESLPILRSRRAHRLGLARKTLFVGGRQSVMKLEGLSPGDMSAPQLMKKGPILKKRGGFTHQDPIIPIRVTSDSFEIERDHMEKEREAIQKEELKRRMKAEGLIEPGELEAPDDEEENKREKSPIPTFEALMTNPVKKIYEDSRTLERLNKLERMRAQFENKPKNTKKKQNYIPSDVSKFTMSYLDINKLRKMAQTVKNTNNRDKTHGFFTPMRGMNLPNMNSTLSGVTAVGQDLLTEDRGSLNRLSAFSKRGAETTSRNRLYETLDTSTTKNTDPSPRAPHFSSQRARSQLSLKDNNRSLTPGSFIKPTTASDFRMKKRKKLTNPIDNMSGVERSLKTTSMLTISTPGTADLPPINFERGDKNPGILIGTLF